MGRRIWLVLGILPTIAGCGPKTSLPKPERLVLFGGENRPSAGATRFVQWAGERGAQILCLDADHISVQFLKVGGIFDLKDRKRMRSSSVASSIHNIVKAVGHGIFPQPLNTM